MFFDCIHRNISRPPDTFLDESPLSQVTDVESNFELWMRAQTVFLPPLSQFSEKLQRQLRDQYMNDSEWHDEPSRQVATVLEFAEVIRP